MSARRDRGDVTGRRAFLRRTAAVAGTAAAAGALPSGVAAQEGPGYDGWLDDTSNFEGTYDFTGQDSVTVRVGAEGNGGNLAFGPAAIRIDPGTEVVWEWTGEGGAHNVVDNAGNFESELYTSAGETFTQTFDSEGTIKYFCVPHEQMGMKAAITVGGSGGLDPSELESAGGGGDGSNGSGGDGGFPLDAVLLVTTLVLGLLSPLVFGLFLLLTDPEDAPPGYHD